MKKETSDRIQADMQHSGVPGELRGLEHLHKGYGILPWSGLIQPAIDLARNGFVVSQDLVNYMASAIAGQSNFLVNDSMYLCELGLSTC